MKKDESTFLLKESAKNLAQIIASSSFEFWERKDFRLYVAFENLTQIEQDRIFNELEVSVLGLFVLHLDYVIETIPKEHRQLFKNLQNDIISSFLGLFSELGVEKKFIKQWELLIDLRLKEYRQDFITAVKEFDIKEEAWEDGLQMIVVVIETIAIDCMTHIRRGNPEKDDPIWKLLRKWFMTLDAPLVSLTTTVPEKLKN